MALMVGLEYQKPLGGIFVFSGFLSFWARSSYDLSRCFGLLLDISGSAGVISLELIGYPYNSFDRVFSKICTIPFNDKLHRLHVDTIPDKISVFDYLW